MKKCFKCSIEKPLSSFYRQNGMKDGYLNKCKECAKSDARQARADDPEKYKLREAKRFINDPKVKARHKKYQNTKEGIASVQKSRKKWEEQNPDKRAANIILGNAVRRGMIEKPDICSICKKDGITIHGHHEDYTKPLNVIWCCPQCHKNIHD